MDTDFTFEQVRIQMFFPCAAKCKWCRTYLKNPQFTQLWKSGFSEKVNDFYLKILKRFRPKNLAISGGEAILMPTIKEFLIEAQKYCGNIRLYTSYQYPMRIIENFDAQGISTDKLYLTHSCIHFIPDKWHDLTNGFPHELYVNNLLLAKKLPFRKQIKFVLNHIESDKEVEAFLESVKPDDNFDLRYKLMNEQNNGFGQAVMHDTKERVKELLKNYNSTLGKPDRYVYEGVMNNNILDFCQYRQKPVEVRFAFWKIIDDEVILKVRFCPYFGPNTHHKYNVSRHSIKKVEKWFMEGSYKDKCSSCRLLHYSS